MDNENKTTDIRYVQFDSLNEDIKPYFAEYKGIDEMWTKTCTCDVNLTVGNDVEGDLYFFNNSSKVNHDTTVGKDEEDLIPNDNGVVERKKYFPNSWSSFCEAYPVTYDEVTINDRFKIAAATDGPEITERRYPRLHKFHFSSIDTAYSFISLAKLLTILDKCVTTPKEQRRFAIVPKNRRRLVSSERDYEPVEFEVIENMSFITYEPHVLMFDNRDQAVEFIEKFKPILIAADIANLIN